MLASIKLSPVESFVLNHPSRSVGVGLIPGRDSQITTRFATTLPTVEQLKTGKFMEQVNYGSELTALMEGDNSIDEETLVELITAQFSHPNGIRGFFISYLTGDEPSPADNDTMPSALLSSLRNIEDKRKLIPLVCMNFVMPAAMMTINTDDELIKASTLSANRGKIVARALLNEEAMKQQVEAIISAATDVESDSEDVKYWENFFDEWKYGPAQKADIAIAAKDVLEN